VTHQPRVEVRAPDHLRPTVEAALRAARVWVAPSRPDLGLLVAAGTPRPTATDDWLVESLPHVVLSVTDTTLRLGPFVLPGTTACLRCLDASRAEEGYAARAAPRDTARDTPPGTGAPAAEMVLLGAALAARELLAWAAGELPRTWSATLDVDAELATWHRRWPRHPHCGCGWGEGLLRA
jgi:hypothetical protein